MHMIVYALVDAPSRDSALSAGRITFDRLVGADPNVAAVFDYYVTFDEEDTTVAGPARWGDLPVVARVDSDDGERLLDRAWDATEAEFERNLNRVKEALEEHSDEAIMRDEDLARHAFHQVGAYDGPSVPLYDEYARGIRHRDRLDRLLDEYQNCWIVPADVHYWPINAPIINWSRESRTPTLEYRNRETGARAVLHRAPDSYIHKWRAAILVDGYPIWSRGFETKDVKRFRDVLRERPAPDLTCPECPNDTVVVGQKSADGSTLKRWFDCPDCGYEARSQIVYGAER